MAAVDNSNSAESNDSENPSKSWKGCLKDFLEYTTAHGCGRIGASKWIIPKVIWIVILLIAYGFFWYQIILLVTAYNKKPILTKVTMQRNKVLDFPVVTICNRNMLRESKITEEIKQKIKEISNTTLEYWEQRNHKYKKTSPHLADSELLHLMKHRSEELRHTVSTVDPEKLREMGHQFQDMVLDCTFDGHDCTRGSNNKNIWRHLWIEDVGNCYMFNRVLPGDGIEPHNTVLTGDRHGLRLLINLEQDEYLEGLSPYAGVKMVVTPQGEMPFPFSEGINVGPGLSTSIALVMKKTLRLDPFGNKSCEKTNKLDPDNIYHKYNMTYSKKACRMSCLSNMQLSRCNCSQYHFTGDDNIAYCIRSNQTIDACLEKIDAAFVNGACAENCPPMCFDIEFSRTVSSYKWPANKFRAGMMESVRNLANVTFTSPEQISDNLLEVHIYYADMDYELFEETLKYESQDLLSNIGGQMGMWIGVSALTIVELVEFFGIVIYLFCRKNPASSTPANTANTTNETHSQDISTSENAAESIELSDKKIYGSTSISEKGMSTNAES